MVAAAVLTVVVAAALVTWVLVHDGGGQTDRATGVDYPGTAAPSQIHATTTEGAR
jgi:hypothetical protein